jgi:hypothetical protein
MWRLVGKINLSSRGGDAISKHINGLGTNVDMKVPRAVKQ